MFSLLATSSRKTPRLSLASKSGLYERAKRRMAHRFKKQTRKGGAPSVVKLRVLHPPESHNRHSFTPSGFREGPLPRKTPRLSLASKSGVYERAKRRMAHPFKKQTRKGGTPSVVKLRVLHPPISELRGGHPPWLKRQGSGYQTRINKLLREAMEGKRRA